MYRGKLCEVEVYCTCNTKVAISPSDRKVDKETFFTISISRTSLFHFYDQSCPLPSSKILPLQLFNVPLSFPLPSHLKNGRKCVLQFSYFLC